MSTLNTKVGFVMGSGYVFYILILNKSPPLKLFFYDLYHTLERNFHKMKLTKLFILFLFLSLKGYSQEAVLTSSGEKVVLSYLSSLGGTISGTLTTKAGINNTGTITNTGAFINTGNLSLNGNGTITGTLGVGGNTTITGTLSTGGTINDLTVSRGGGNVNGNTAVGGSALNANNTGINNTAFGSEALLLNQGGGHNTAFGKDALSTNVSGINLTAVGYQSLKVNTASNNTAVGYRSLYTNTSGTLNTAIGYQADVSSGNLTNATAIGYLATATASNTIQLGNSAVTAVTTSGTITAGGMQNTPIGSTIASTGAFTSLSTSGLTTINNNATITGTLTLPSLSASTLIGTDGSSQIGTVILTGDITTDGLVATLSNTGVISGTYGSSTVVPQITVDAKGRITTITTTAITVSGGSTITYTIGLYPELGGYVFYVTPNGKHGLVAETIDQSTPTCTWYNAQNFISDPANHSNAGKLFTDWRLPTKYELNLLYLKKIDIGGFANLYYWSSTEYDPEYAWNQYFNNSNPYYFTKLNSFYVRAIRAF
jgi:hypothetical protein